MPKYSEYVKAKFSENLRYAMRESGISAVSMSADTGINTSTIRGYMLGKTLPKVDLLCLICESLGTTPDELIGYER